MDNVERIDKITEYISNFFKSIEEVPKWRLVIAFIFLGENVMKSFNKIGELK